MSGIKRIISGEIAQGKAKGSALASALSEGLNSIIKGKEKQPLKKQVGK